MSDPYAGLGAPAPAAPSSSPAADPYAGIGVGAAWAEANVPTADQAFADWIRPPPPDANPNWRVPMMPTDPDARRAIEVQAAHAGENIPDPADHIALPMGANTGQAKQVGASFWHSIASLGRGIGGYQDTLNRNAVEGGYWTDPSAGELPSPFDPVPVEKSPIAALVPQYRAGGSPMYDAFGHTVAPLDKAASKFDVRAPTWDIRLAGDVGSSGPLLAAGAASPATGFGVFGAQGYDQTYRDAKAAGATDAQAQQAAQRGFLINGAIGLVPGGSAAELAPALKGPVVNGLARTGMAFVGNADVGAGLQVANNLNAQSYDPNRPIGAGVLDSALGFGIFGAALHGGHEALSVRSLPAADPYAKVAGEPAPASADPYADVGAPATPMKPPMSFSDLASRVEQRESGGHQFTNGHVTTSSKGAFGDMQLMPATADAVARAMGQPELAEQAKSDPAVNRQLGQAYLQGLLNKFGDETAATAAYNAGPGVVDDWIHGTNRSGKNRSGLRLGRPSDVGAADWAAAIPFKETRAYVQHILGDHLAGDAGVSAAPLGDAADIVAPFAEADAQDTATQYAPDLTDQALEILRNGDKVRSDQGPSLIEFLARGGGLTDTGGELSAMDADRWHRGAAFRPRLVQDAGLSLGDAAVKAQEAGYLPDLAAFAGSDTRAQPQHLLDAIRQELAGSPIYAREGQSPALAQHVQDLDELLTHIGIDPAQHSNTDLRGAIEEFLNGTTDHGDPYAGLGAPAQDNADYSVFAARPSPSSAAPSESDKLLRGPGSPQHWQDFVRSYGGLDQATPERYQALYGVKPAMDGQVQPEAYTQYEAYRASQRGSPATETVNLANGAAEQALAPGIEPVDATRASIIAELRRRQARRGAAALPEGGLFDQAGQAQQDLFSPESNALRERLGGRLSEAAQGAEDRQPQGRLFARQATPLVHPEASRVLGDQGAANLSRLIESRATANAVFKGLAPAYEARGAVTPTLPAGSEGTPEFWASRRYEGGLDAPAAVDHLVRGAKAFAGGEPARDRIATLVLGPTAAGKSTVAEHLARQTRSALLDSDEAKKIIPGYRDGLGADTVHNESSALAARVGGRLIQEGANIVRPTVGADAASIRATVRGFQDAGYKVNLVHVKVPYDEAVRRMAGRYLRTGRLIGEDYIRQVGAKPRETYYALRHEGIADGYAEIDAGGPKGSERVVDAHNPPANLTLGQKLHDRGAGGGHDVPPREGGSGPLGGKLRATSPKGLREAPVPEGIATPAGERPTGAAFKGQTMSQIAGRLREALGLTHRQGRLQGRTSLGEYDPKTAVVRTRDVHEVDVLAHEGGHALEYQKHPALMDALKRHDGDLRKLAYPGADPAAKRQEGFAEFFRWYLTNPDYAQKVAPRFYADFEAALGKDRPKMLADLRQLQEAYQTFLKSPSAATAAASLVQWSRPSVVRDFVQSFRRNAVSAVTDLAHSAYAAFADDLAPVGRGVSLLRDVYEANTGRKLDLKAIDNPYKLARLSRAAYASGHMDVMHGVRPYGELDPVGPSLPDALELALGRKSIGKWDKHGLQDFGQYLVSRRMVKEWERFGAGKMDRPPDKYSGDFHQHVIDDFEAANPTWREAAAMVHSWADNLWDKEHAAGLISAEAHQAGKLEHPDYVPVMRDMSDRPGVAGKQTKGPGKYAGLVKRFRGSTRDVINPIQSLMQRSYELSTLIERNDVFKALDDLGQKAGPGAGAIIERIPRTEVHGQTVDAMEAVAKAAKAAGLAPRDISTLIESLDATLGGEAMAKVYKAGEINERGEPIIYVWRNGEKYPLRLPDGRFGKEMFDALTAMNQQSKSLLVQILSAPTQALRFGVTTSPDFFLSNYIRDQVANWINTDVGFKPFVSGAHGVAMELAQGDVSRRYNSMGGIVGGANTSSLDRARINRDINALNKRGLKVRRFASPAGLIHFSEISESGTRLAVYKLAFDKAKRAGMTDVQAAREAAFTARDLLDFDRRGSKMLWATKTMTFLNASLQGLDKAARVLSAEGRAPSYVKRTIAPWFDAKAASEKLTPSERAALAHAGKAWMKMAALGVLGMSLRATYANDPDYEEISDYLRSTHWMMKAGGHWLAVPKPFELAALSDIMERGYERIAMHDPTAWDRLRGDLGQVLAPPHDIPGLAVAFQVASNKNNQGAPIVPDSLKNVEPAEQFTAYTSRLGKALGKATNTSPAVIDYALAGVTGSWGRTIQGLSNVGAKAPMAAAPEDSFISRRFFRDPTRGSTSQAEFTKQMSADSGRLTQVANTVHDLVREGRDSDLTAYMKTLTPQEHDYAMTALLPGDMAGRFNPMNRAQKATAVLGDLRRENADGELTTLAGQPISLTPEQRRAADQVLSRYAMAEMRNALISVGQPGWAQKRPMSTDDLRAQLAAISPDVGQAVDQRLAFEKIAPAPVSDRVWSQVRGRLPQIEDRVGDQGLASMKRAQTNAGKLKDLQLSR